MVAFPLLLHSRSAGVNFATENYYPQRWYRESANETVWLDSGGGWVIERKLTQEKNRVGGGGRNG